MNESKKRVQIEEVGGWVGRVGSIPVQKLELSPLTSKFDKQFFSRSAFEKTTTKDAHNAHF